MCVVQLGAALLLLHHSSSYFYLNINSSHKPIFKLLLEILSLFVPFHPSFPFFSFTQTTG